jgi:hypothetical protein
LEGLLALAAAFSSFPVSPKRVYKLLDNFHIITMTLTFSNYLTR